MMQIMKASAGSGKTFNLAKTYISNIFRSKDKYAYRHILAVTFTNKATAEMKGRILKELDIMSRNPKGSNYYKDFRKEFFESDEEMQKAAESVLVNILHDYSAFSVSTIDKFFQQALKAFSREVGQFASYQIELNKDALIDETVDRILESLSEDKAALVDWLNSYVMAELSRGNKFNLDKKLKDTCKRLKIDNKKRVFSKDSLAEVHKECDKIIERFITRFKEVAPELAQQFKLNTKITEPKKKDYKCYPDGRLEELFTSAYKEYLTAYMIRNEAYLLGVASEFSDEFDALMKEKNVLNLDDSNTILKDIIDGSDAPFVYEKLGVRYESFLLDEFQDTSTIQWSNFLPLLKDSQAKGGSNLILGDVKQSIYRWRGSEWNLLAKELPEQFPEAKIINLSSNWRSLKQVVDFNNSFFSYAASALGLDAVYEGVKQEYQKSEDQEGCVRISFTGDKNQKELVYASVLEAVSQSARYSDIAVIVRNNKDGSSIAAHLLSNSVPVVSDDSLDVKSSLTVRRLIALLSYMDNSESSLSKYTAESLNVEIPEYYHSLTDLCEYLLLGLKKMDAKTFSCEVPYIQTFMDDVQEWTSVNGNNLKYFLEYVKESNVAISTPSGQNAVRIITIHKAKGLEFPYVIFPFADKVEVRAEKSWCWCRPDEALSNLAPDSELEYPVTMKKEVANTFFDKSYWEEKNKLTVDMINLFYVACTRAEKSLHIISDMPSKAFRESLEKNKEIDYSKMSWILYAYTKTRGCQFGKPYIFDSETKSAEEQKEFLSEYDIIPLDGRLQASVEAEEFFSEQGAAMEENSPRRRGVVMHNILSKLDRVEDLHSVIQGAVSCGDLSEQGVSAVETLLEMRLEQARERGWFPPAGSESWHNTIGRNELSLMDVDGKEFRPDRVVIRDSEVIIIDYKFGEKEDSYVRQVRKYMNLYRSMGYSKTKGYVWYVPDGEVVQV